MHWIFKHPSLVLDRAIKRSKPLPVGGLLTGWLQVCRSDAPFLLLGRLCVDVVGRSPAVPYGGSGLQCHNPASLLVCDWLWDSPGYCHHIGQRETNRIWHRAKVGWQMTCLQCVTHSWCKRGTSRSPFKKEASFFLTSCWLSLNDGLIWSFFGPVCLIIILNAFFFIITVWKLAQKFTSLNPDLTSLHKIRSVSLLLTVFHSG